ncbi:urokinase-type plasminogen activator [Latimeria chalumnae]|uniref:urokinase-type plasminogen activator n=1 Tax=Latimeria chalumnae TaxID=7897 RepID=UPI0003C1649F|nr:PREDICTED: urokinase-type plasminogen activator [Latimeria chalumnae]|eukprot:XP_006005097.1 PREDICTED: urokinase-type plasminogen activator [Latimeria chalumnae]
MAKFLFFLLVALLLATLSLQTSLWIRSEPSIRNSRTGACDCLNGGSCVRHEYFPTYSYCLCPKGFSGRHCETDTRTQCYEDNGEDYRGTATLTESGKECLWWNSNHVAQKFYSAYNSDALQLGLGKHNYCRNPDRSKKPWCYVRRRGYITYNYCDIPKCDSNPASSCGQRKFKIFKIVGGERAALESQPWIAAIFQYNHRMKRDFFSCGGSLIDSCWVLTAAHCFPDLRNSRAHSSTNDFSVILGKSALNETDAHKEQRFQVERIVLHPEYDDSNDSYNNDIALLKLKSTAGKCALETNYVRPVCLPPEGLSLKDGWQCEIAGYGKEKYSHWYYSQKLKEATIELISQETCKTEDYYGSKITDNMLCAGHPQWKVDSCKGDSGGPMVCEKDNRMILYGIISWGDGCGKKNKPGVYTRVTRYNTWIQQNVNQGVGPS